MIEVRLKTDKDKYSSNKAIKYVVQLGELKSYLTEKELIELRTKLNTFAIPDVVQAKPEKVCKGSMRLSTGCGKCKRCKREIEHI